MNRDFNSGTKDLIKLLDSGSDSDALELLSLPPLKKTNSKTSSSKRKRNRLNGQTVCSIWVVVKTVVVLALIGTMSYIGVLTYQLTKQVADLKTKIEKAENSNHGIPAELESIKSQVQDMNKTLLKYRTGKQGLEEVIKNLTDVSKKVKVLQNMLKESKKKMGGQTEEASVDGKALAKSVATFGLDVGELKTQHKELAEKTNQKMTDLEDRVKRLENLNKMFNPPASGSEDTVQTGALTTQIEELRGSLQTTNTSLFEQIIVLQQELAGHESRFASLEGQVAKEPVTINSTAMMITLRDQLTSYIQTMISNATKPPPSVTSDSVLETIKDQLKNITESVVGLEQQINTDQTSAPASADTAKLIRALEVLHGHQNTTDNTVDYLNTSVSSLEKTVDKLMSLYIKEKNMIVNLTSQVDGVRRYLNTLPTAHDVMNNSKTEAVTPGMTADQTTEDVSKSTKAGNRRDTANMKKEEIEKIFE